MAHTIPDFDPDGMRPFFFTRWTVWKTGWWFAVVAVLLALAITASLFQSGLPASTTAAGFLDEFRRLFGLPPLHPALSIGWPAWRDPVSIVLVLAMAWTPLNAAQQVAGCRRLLSHLEGSGVVALPDAVSRAKVAQIVARANRRIRWWRYPAAPILGLYIALCGFLFSRFAEWYDGETWWIGDNPVLVVLFVVVCAVGLYTAMMQNICGGIISRAVIDIRPHVEVGVDLLNVDRRWGWRPVGTILGATYRDITVHLFALIALVLSSPYTDFWWWVSTFVLLLSMATAPLWIVFPFRFTRRLVDDFRVRELALIEDSRRGDGSFSIKAAARVDRLNSVPSVPFLRFWSVLAGVVAQLVNVWALVGVGQAVLDVVMGKVPTI